MSKNVIFILADDMGEWALGRRCPDAITPNLDKMCDDGSYFENFYCASPVCSPARASIITGTYPSTHGIHDWIRSGNVDINDPVLSSNVKNSNEYKDENECIDFLCGLPSYLEFFKNKGYNTALFGKWHLGDSIKCGGFDTHINIIRGGCSYYKADVLRNNEITFENEYITNIVTNDVIEYIKKQNNEKPFYISVHYTAPHSPWGEKEHPQQYFNLYKNCQFASVPNLAINPKQISTAPVGDTEEKRLENLRGYFAAITAMDNCIGKIMSTLEEKGLLENTEIIFTSDNGMNMGHHGIWGKGNGTYPQNMYETSVKVPFVRYLKGQEPKVYKECYSHVDILPTMAKITQSVNPYENELYGRALPIYDSDDEIKRSVKIISEYGKVRMIRRGNLKLILDYIENNHQLFDLSKDFNEENNLYNIRLYKSIIDEMTLEINEFFEKYGTCERNGLNQEVFGRGQLSKIEEANVSAKYASLNKYFI